MTQNRYRSPAEHARLLRDQRVHITVLAERRPELVELWVALEHRLAVDHDEILVAPPGLDPGVMGLQLAHGQLWIAPQVTLEHGQPNQCHRNTARLWLAGRISAIVSGWALGPGDGLWRQHSFGWRGPLAPSTPEHPLGGPPEDAERIHASVVETTVVRDRYFGVALTPALAWLHATENLGTRAAITQATPHRLAELRELLAHPDAVLPAGLAGMLDTTGRD